MTGVAIQEEVPLQAMHTLASPSTAAFFARLEETAHLPGLLDHARAADWPVRVLGGGSNVVLGDLLPGLTLQQACRGIEVLERSEESVLLRVHAGENWHAFVSWCLAQGYFGLENLALIPGTVGAAPIQNVGAYGVEVAPFIEQVHCRSLSDGGPRSLSRGECRFGYRDSIFKRELRDRVLVESVDFALPLRESPVTDYPTLRRYLQEQGISEASSQQVFAAVVAVRSARLPDPAQVPNAGSFFKNPVVDRATLDRLSAAEAGLPYYRDTDSSDRYKLAAAWLIEACGFKNRGGPVRVHPQHALVIINPERRPAAEIAALAADISEAVRERFDLLLEQEPRSYG